MQEHALLQDLGCLPLMWLPRQRFSVLTSNVSMEGTKPAPLCSVPYAIPTEQGKSAFLCPTQARG